MRARVGECTITPARRKGRALMLRMSTARSWLASSTGVYEFVSAEAWRAFAVEFVGTFFFLFLHMSLVCAAISFGEGTGAVVRAEVTIAVFTTIMAMILIFTMAPVSGGHLNPLITVSTMFTGLIKPARALMSVTATRHRAACSVACYHLSVCCGCACGCGRYVAAQFGGGYFGGFIFWVVVDTDHAIIKATELAGCGSFGKMSTGRAFIGETVFCFFVLWVAYSLVRRRGVAVPSTVVTGVLWCAGVRPAADAGVRRTVGPVPRVRGVRLPHPDVAVHHADRRHAHGALSRPGNHLGVGYGPLLDLRRRRHLRSDAARGVPPHRAATPHSGAERGEGRAGGDCVHGEHRESVAAVTAVTQRVCRRRLQGDDQVAVVMRNMRNLRITYMLLDIERIEYMLLEYTGQYTHPAQGVAGKYKTGLQHNLKNTPPERTHSHMREHLKTQHTCGRAYSVPAGRKSMIMPPYIVDNRRGNVASAPVNVTRR